MQDAFVRLARRGESDSGLEASFGYLATSVRNGCFDLLRQRRRRPTAGTVLERASTASSEEERLMLEQALGSLPEEQCEVVYLKVYEGLTFQEIADRTGVGLNTAASRFRYAMRALRRALAGERERC